MKSREGGMEEREGDSETGKMQREDDEEERRKG